MNFGPKNGKLNCFLEKRHQNSMHMAENHIKKHAHGPNLTKNDTHWFAHGSKFRVLYALAHCTWFFSFFKMCLLFAHELKSWVMCNPAQRMPSNAPLNFQNLDFFQVFNETSEFSADVCLKNKPSSTAWTSFSEVCLTRPPNLVYPMQRVHAVTGANHTL